MLGDCAIGILAAIAFVAVTDLIFVRILAQSWRGAYDTASDYAKTLKGRVEYWKAEADWLRGELEAERDMRLGNYETFDNVDDLIASLDE